MTSLLALAASGCVWSSEGPPPPRLVTQATVDTGPTLTVSPGTGAGVFVEYQAGGHWHVWWTCDTNLSGLPCTFHVDVIAQSGTIGNVAGDRLEANDSLVTPNPTEVTLDTSTSTGVDGVFFDTDPGAAINVLQVIGDAQDGTYFYWSQGGQILGGGDVDAADPMSFVGSSP